MGGPIQAANHCLTFHVYMSNGYGAAANKISELQGLCC